MTLLGIMVSMTTGIALGTIAFRELVAERPLGRDTSSLEAVVQRVRDSYVEPIAEETLTENAIRGSWMASTNIRRSSIPTRWTVCERKLPAGSAA